jgi:hypothetical protein
VAQRGQGLSVPIAKRTVARSVAARQATARAHSYHRISRPNGNLRGASARKPLELGALGLCNLRCRGPKTANAVGYGPLIVGVICKAFPQASSYRPLNES